MLLLDYLKKCCLLTWMFLIWPSRKDFNGCKKQSEDLCTKSFSASPILFSASPTLANIAPFDNTFVWIQNSNQILFTIAIYHIGSRSRCHCWHPQNNDQEARYYLAWSLLCRDPGRAWSTKSLQFYHLMNKRLIQNDRQRYIYKLRWQLNLLGFGCKTEFVFAIIFSVNPLVVSDRLINASKLTSYIVFSAPPSFSPVNLKMIENF